jgi:hypothetical protein
MNILFRQGLPDSDRIKRKDKEKDERFAEAAAAIKQR